MLAVLTDTQPKLVVLDVNLLGNETRPLLALIKAIAPRTHTVVLVDTSSSSKRCGQPPPIWCC